MDWIKVNARAAEMRAAGLLKPFVALVAPASWDLSGHDDTHQEGERGADGKLLHPGASPKGIEQLVGRRWDVVIDNSCYNPRIARASAELLDKHAAHYLHLEHLGLWHQPARRGRRDHR